jgi:hypothetical protein
VLNSSGVITLFSERPQQTQRPYTFVLSILAHGAAIALVSLGFLYAPRISPQTLAERYTLRHLDLHSPEPLLRRSSSGGISYPGSQAAAHAAAAESKAAARASMSRLTAKLEPAPQTLVQPDLPPNIVLPKIPVPTVVLWTPAKTPPKAIVPPPPQKAAAADVLPSIKPPNVEVNLADLEMSSSKFEPKIAQPVVPSTSSPVVVHGPELPQQPPQTTTLAPAPPTPAAVLSLSDLHVREGTVMLPPANETASAKSASGLDSGRADDPAKTGSDSPAGKTNGTAAGHDAGASGDKDKAATSGSGNSQQNAAKSGPGAGTQAGAGKSAQSGAGLEAKTGAGAGNGPSGNHETGGKTGPAEGSATGSDSGSGFGPPAERINLPRDGQFGVVVVGSSLEEKYPETAELWSGRLSYTVYLHVGLAKSWILQYSLPRAAEAAAAGNVARLAAPWPYNIVRPYIAPGEINADALMIHGIVNTAGRFEDLAVVFPPEFAQAKAVLNAIQQWQFRPAAQAGQNIPVEVLLIIPEIEE